ncbi:MAG: hypothetical protein RJQ10_06420 [Haliea sp.]|uniref:hypothetical protein n=1 Tax=Haliea sp. TaxID=1932666 RepID=UPI0032ED1574
MRLVQEVEVRCGKRMVVFDDSGHAPFLTETVRFVEILRGFGADIAAACRTSSASGSAP